MRMCVHSIDAFTEYSGRLLAWLTLGMALLTGLIVVLRYGFGIGSIAAQEAVMYMHGSLFLLGAVLCSESWSSCSESIFFTVTSCKRTRCLD